MLTNCKSSKVTMLTITNTNIQKNKIFTNSLTSLYGCTASDYWVLPKTQTFQSKIFVGLQIPFAVPQTVFSVSFFILRQSHLFLSHFRGS